MEKNYIYTLSLNNVIFYVGKTINVNKRLATHVMTYGKNVLLEILEESYNWKEDEKYWIEQFKHWGFNLKNKNLGGGGSEISSEYTRNLIKINQPKIKKPCSEERKIKIGLSQPKTKKPCSEERKIKISVKNKGKKKNLGKKYNCKSYKIVSQYNINGEFIRDWPSVKEILISLNKKPNNMMIHRCLLGSLKTSYGSIWKYKNK